MTKPNDTRNLLIQLIEPVCESAGYELVQIHYAREQGGWVVRVFIDDSRHDDADIDIDSHISFEDCERISRELSALLDVEDPLPHAYRLEVSSPGVDRPLRTAAHFRRFAGQRAKVSLHQGIEVENGIRRNFTGTLVGVDADADGAETVVIDVDGAHFALPISDLSSARLIPDWDELARRKSSKPSAHGVA